MIAAKRVCHFFLIAAAVATIACQKNCRMVKIEVVSPLPPKQGDSLEIKISATPANKIVRVDYEINGATGSVMSVPATVTAGTCKSSGRYMTRLTLKATARFNDSKVVHDERGYGLTEGNVSREDTDSTYATYIVHGSNMNEQVAMYMAGKFNGAFDAYSRDQYYWSDPDLYFSRATEFANNTDMAITIGHNVYDVSGMAFGNMAQCRFTGDLEYFIYAGCYTLSLEKQNGAPFWESWFHFPGSELEPRPFSGLHVAMGFRKNFVVDSYHWGYWRSHCGKKFFRAFANRLDDGVPLAKAWLDAASKMLSQKHDNNLAAAVYLKCHENDTVYTTANDFIYDNDHYTSANGPRKVAVFLD